MCGISVIIKKDKARVLPAELCRMSSAIAHRGPDGAGYAMVRAGQIGLAHVRLSVIDPSRGHQPLYDANQNLCITYNGEIYDHAALRNDFRYRSCPQSLRQIWARFF